MPVIKTGIFKSPPLLNEVLIEQQLNRHPIIFVHGFAGFSNDNTPLGILPYWGGLKVKLTESLRKEGFLIHEASIGSMTSSYDRAVELYYYIKGGRTDYGPAHAKKYGHKRYGRSYPGVYPDWSPGQPVHLLGHSMGGQTIRILEELLRHGSEEEIVFCMQNHIDIPELFTGGKTDMINTITTVATPHNGTYVADKLGNRSLIKMMSYWLIETENNLNISKTDWGFDQWGVKEETEESPQHYYNRISKNRIWKTTDNGYYDLTIEGSALINKRTSINPNIRYKTYAGTATHPGIMTHYHTADIRIFPPFHITAMIGGRNGSKEWWENDGLVSRLSAEAPFNQVRNDSTDDNERGIWHVNTPVRGWDHLDLIGCNPINTTHSGKDVMQLYRYFVRDMLRFE